MPGRGGDDAIGELPPEVIDEARASHPFVQEGRARRKSSAYRHIGPAPFSGPLPEPPGHPAELRFEPGVLQAVRKFVARHAQAARLGLVPTAELVVAVNEVATNSLRHGGGLGTLRIWQDGDAVVCEVRDRGQISYPLVGRESPAPDNEGGRGLWLANQLCDLVQIRSSAAGTVVRLHMGPR